MATININIIIDTSRLMIDFTNPSKDPDNPTGISHDYEYMVVSDNAKLTGQGTGDLEFQTAQGDVVRFYATSEFNNFQNVVILYGMFKMNGADVFKDAKFSLETFNGHKTVVPTQFNPLAYASGNQDFWFAQNTVNNYGEEAFGLRFAVFDSKNKLYGYFYWDPKIKCSEDLRRAK